MRAELVEGQKSVLAQLKPRPPVTTSRLKQTNTEKDFQDKICKDSFDLSWKI